MKGLRVWLRGVGALLGVVLLGIGVDRGYTLLLTSPRFALQAGGMEGVVSLDPKTLEAVAGITRGAPLFLVDLDQVVTRLQGHPWIQQVVVRREPPHTLRIRIQERVPVAYIQLQKTFFLVDETGMVLDRSSRADRSLPVIRGRSLEEQPQVGRALEDPILRQALELRARLAEAPPLQGMQQWVLEVDGQGAATLWLGKTRILLGRESQVERLQRFFQVASQILRPQEAVREIDLRFANQVVVRP